MHEVQLVMLNPDQRRRDRAVLAGALALRPDRSRGVLP